MKKKIDLSDVYKFVKNKYKNCSIDRRKFILAKMIKFVRLLNNEPNIIYNKKIKFA